MIFADIERRTFLLIVPLESCTVNANNCDEWIKFDIGPSSR